MKDIDSKGYFSGMTGDFVVKVENGNIISITERGGNQLIASLDEFFYVARLAGYVIKHKDDNLDKEINELESITA
jgi:hypothetical protein